MITHKILDRIMPFSFKKSSPHRRFQKILHDFQAAKAEFGAEVELAKAKSDAQYQGIVQSKLAHAVKCQPIETTMASILFARNPLFTGRNEILDAMLNHLGLSSRDGPVRTKVCWLHGIGGIGKTEIAREYLHRVKDTYSKMFWLEANSEHNLGESLISLGQNVGIYKPNMK